MKTPLSSKEVPVTRHHMPHTVHRSRRPDLLFRAGTGVVVMAAALAMTGCGSSAKAASPAAGGDVDVPASSQAATTLTSLQRTSHTVVPAKTSAGNGTAAAALATLPIKGRAPKTGYSRAQFGPAWADVNHNGCDTRNDILARDLHSRTVRAGTHGCIITSGVLNDPYTARTIRFTRGEKTSTAVQIDHVVALSDAWQTGAQKLSASARQSLANDPLELLAVDGPSNERKSDGDAATWLPANKAFRCQYVSRQVAVKVRYKLWVTKAEHDAIARVLSGCKGQKLATAAAPIVVWKTAAAAKVPAKKAPAKKAVVKKAAAKKVAKKAPVKKAVKKTVRKAAPKKTAKKVVRKAAPKRVVKKAAPKRVVKKAVHKKAPAKKVVRKSSSVYYKNCAAARKAGAAPLHRWSPGYRSGLDRDNDGVACE